MLTPGGRVVQAWTGTEKLFNQAISKQVFWSGRSSTSAMPDGVSVALNCGCRRSKEVNNLARKPVAQVVSEVLLHNKAEVTTQAAYANRSGEPGCDASFREPENRKICTRHECATIGYN